MAKRIASRLWRAWEGLLGFQGEGRSVTSLYPARLSLLRLASGGPLWSSGEKVGPRAICTGAAIAALVGGGTTPLVLRRRPREPGQTSGRARRVFSAIAGSIPRGAYRRADRLRDGTEGGGSEDRSPVSLHVGGGVAVITLRRPQKLNAINSHMWVTLVKMVHEVSKRPGVRVLVLRGEGPHFSAGSDLKELSDSDLVRVEEIFHQAEECAAAIEESPLPTIACIRGYALGTGLLMALACDMRIAEHNATLGMPIARLGITLSEAFVRRLVLLTGPSKMKDLVYTGRLVDAEEAFRLGLVDRLVPPDKSVLHETLNIARTIRRQSEASVRAAKRWGGSGSRRAPAAYTHVDPRDFPEGVAAFLERRSPRFYDPS